MEPWVAVGGFLLNLGVMLTGGVWWLGRLEQTVLEKAKAHTDEVKKDTDQALGIVGGQISHLNMWTRDTFVRREDFYPALDNVNNSIQALGANVDNRMTRLEVKIDKIASGNNEGTK
jgi:hypothetical protein